MNYKVLMIDDDEVIAASTAEYFNLFDVKTAYVTSYDEAVSFLDENTVSLLLLDINLGENSGFDLCKKVREHYDMPILFVSARTSDDDVLIALNIGGDDYIKKPYTLSIAASPAAPASEPAPAAAVYNISADITLDTNTHKLMVRGNARSLKDMEYKLLLYLLMNRGRVVTKDELLRKVWEDEFIGEGTIAVHIRHIREKTEDDPKDPKLIKTIWGVGYILDA